MNPSPVVGEGWGEGSPSFRRRPESRNPEHKVDPSHSPQRTGLTNESCKSPRKREPPILTRYRLQRLDKLRNSINDPPIVATHPDQLLKPTPEIVWVSPSGDSKLYRGEALDVLSSIADETVDCVWTDPPYLLSNGGITRFAGRMVSVDKGEWDKSRGIEADHQFNLEWTAECYRILKPTVTIWVSGTLHIYPNVGMALVRNGFRLLNDIIWEKPNPPPNLGRRTFTHSTEVVLWASKAKKGSRHKYTFNYDEMRRENGGKQMKTVWRFKAPGQDEKRFGKHPTQKPIALIDRCLRASTNPGDLVLDPFSGTASTGVAALSIDRRFIGIELSQEFVDIGVERIAHIYPPPPPPAHPFPIYLFPPTVCSIKLNLITLLIQRRILLASQRQTMNG